MFCPRCGQEQISDETRFCSRCGFLMSGVSELIVNEGLIPEKYVQYKGGANSPKKRGIKQGALLFLSGALIVPLLGIIVVGILNFEGYIVGIAALLTFLGGILRMLYAILFESNNPGDETLEDTIIETKQKLFNKKTNVNALPPQQSIPVSNYVPPVAGNWRDTNDLQPTSVTENTTKLLEHD
ncbi:MAG: zinc ribbon domain-containing protein [Pyrinomonadaceae bacterium]